MRYLIVFFLVICPKVALCVDDFKEHFPAQGRTAGSALQLTQKEKRWIARHKKIRVAYDGSLPPFSFVNDHGKIDGIAVEIISLLGKGLGIDFSIHTDSDWDRLYRSAAKRKFDIVATMVSRPDRAEWFSFTKPYLTKSLVVVIKQDNTAIKNRDDIADKKIAVVKGYQYGEQVNQEFPKAKRLVAVSMLDSLLAVDKGQADAAILFLGTANYLQAKHQLGQLKVAAFYDRNQCR